MSRLKKIMKWTGIGAAVLVAILLIVHAILCWVSGSRLEKRLTAARENGDPVSLADLARNPIPPEQNAATYLRRAAKDLAAINKEFAATKSKTFSSNKPSPEDLKFIKSTLDAYPDVLPLIEKAAGCPDFDSQLNFTVDVQEFLENLLESLQLYRMVYRAIDPHVTLLLSEGKRDEAMQSCIRMFRLTRHFDREPMIVGHLVSLACRSVAGDMANRVLNDGPLSAKLRNSLEEELAKHDDMLGYVWALKSERALGCELVRSYIDGGGWMITWYLRNQQCKYLDMMQQQVQMGAASHFETEEEMAEVVESTVNMGPLIGLIVPALTASRDAMNRTRAIMRCLRVLNALQADEKQNGMEKPNLAALGLPKNATIDPYDGKALRVKKIDDGWVIYSIGMDMKDDGGQFHDHKDVGAGLVAKP